MLKTYGLECTYSTQAQQEVIYVAVIGIVKQIFHSSYLCERLNEDLDATSDIEKLKAHVERIRKALCEVENKQKNATKM